LWLKEHVLDQPGGAKYKILVPGPGIRHIDQTLKLMRISKKRILYYPKALAPATIHHFKKELLFVDWVAPKEDVHGTLAHDGWSPVYQPREALVRVRDLFHDLVDEASPAHLELPWLVVFVSRQKAVRMVHNEAQLIESIKKAVGEEHVLVHTGTETLMEQATMFKRAKVVVGAHGAGLTNLVYCHPGTGFVMLPMAPHADHTYNHMAAALQLKSWIVSEVASNYYNHYGYLTEEQIDLVVSTVDRAVSSVVSGVDTEFQYEHDDEYGEGYTNEDAVKTEL
jgi:hypothetical protein